MKVLCDVHIARKIVRFFQANEIEAIHTNDILDSYFTKDSDLSRYADAHDYVIMSKDADFKDSHFLKNVPQKLLKVSLGNISTTLLISILEQNLPLLKEKFDAGSCYIEVNVDSIIVIGK